MRYLSDEDYENMTDEEIDEFHRPKKTNSRKSLAPLFVYMILRGQTDEVHPFTQGQIIEKLEEYPYEITIERKAVGRILHNLEDSGRGIVSGSAGVWYDEARVWAA